MENPAIRQTRQSKDISKPKEPEPLTNLRTTPRQKNILSYFSKKTDLTESCPTPKKKLKLSGSAKGSKEPTPKKTPLIVKENEEEETNHDKLPRNQKQLEKLLSKVKQKINFYKSIFFQEQREIQGFYLNLPALSSLFLPIFDQM